MAKRSSMVAVGPLVSAALCLAYLLRLAYSQETLFVEGKVYCDVCRVEFQTTISEVLEGATVKLECRSRESDALTYELEGTTDKNGMYSLKADGDHEEDICEIRLVKSPRADCSEPFKSIERARVLLTQNVGVAEPVRFANALGFMTSVAHPDCGKVLQDMGFVPIN